MRMKMKVDSGTETPYESPSQANRVFYRTLAGERPGLFAAIIAFNRNRNQDPNTADGDLPDNTLSDDGVSDEVPSKPHNLPAKNLSWLPDASNRAKAMLFPGDNAGFWDFKEESRRMALLPPPLLNDLILKWGAAFCAPILNRIILRGELEVVDRDIGQPLVDFARGRGRLNLGDLSGIIALTDREVTPEKIRPMIVMCGMKAHGICRATWPNPLKTVTDNHLKQELPELFKHRFEPEKVEPPHFRAVWFSMKKILLKEVAPEWTPCFS